MKKTGMPCSSYKADIQEEIWYPMFFLQNLVKLSYCQSFMYNSHLCSYYFRAICFKNVSNYELRPH